MKVDSEAENWLKSPINSEIGTLWLAGSLNSNSYIPPNKMRILGRYALILVLEGTAYYEDANGQKSTLPTGTAILVTPELAHAYGGLERQTWRQSYVVFDGPQFDLLQTSKSFRNQQPYRTLESIEEWNHRLSSLMRAMTTNQRSNSSLRNVAQFSEFLVEMMTSQERSKPLIIPWLESSLELLGNPNGDRWISPQDVAIRVGLSYENFRKLFNLHTGQPPARFQRQRKIDRACAAIYRGAVNFKELAEELEFCDVYHFSKAFRQIKGIPPSTYRRSVRGQ